ncbi:MAG: methylamine utilization protein MauJ [Terriglobales bacterium]
MNSNSGFYRFLCFYKIIESIDFRRSRTNSAAKQSGQGIRRFREVVPSDAGELLTLLKEVYPWRTQWDTLALDQIVPADVRGKKIGWVREKHLIPLRVGIAHALLKTGEIRITLDKLEHIQQVNKWLPLCRILARMVLRNEFPTEFGLAMKPLFFGQGAS